MRVALDCVPFLVRSAGVKAYLFELHWHLRKQFGKEAVISFPFLDDVSSFHHEGSVVGPLATFLRYGLLYFVNLPHNHTLDLLGRHVDVFHCSNQIRNPPRNAKLTTIVHDTTAWSHPELHTAATVINDKRFAERIVKRADGIVVPSQSSGNDAVRWLGIQPERVRVIHHGVAETYFTAESAEIYTARAEYKLQKPYILFVSTIEPRKNLDRLIDAYQSMSPDLQQEWEFVVAGPQGWASAATVARLQQVRYLGYVPERFLPGLVAGATVFAYPSLYEGFGFPVAQAMAAGIPVLTSQVSSLPEITGNGGLLVDPLSPSEIRKALEELLLSPSLRLRLSEHGKARAAHYRWERCARETWRFFESVC
jgi:glycosyltransferase involved in cell wall biosynthesis